MSDRRPGRDRSGDTSIPHGTVYGYDKLGCRCASCSDAYRERRRTLRAKRALRKANGDVEDHTHGLSGYTNWNCRCEVCVEAKREYGETYRSQEGQKEKQAEYQRRWLAKRGPRARRYVEPKARAEYLQQWREAKSSDDIPHGTSNGYDNYHCRCSPCAEAHALRVSQSRARVNSETLASARNHQQQWTGAELEIVTTRHDLPLRELAKLLGRSRHAVASARRRALKEPKWIKVAGVSESQTYPQP